MNEKSERLSTKKEGRKKHRRLRNDLVRDTDKTKKE